MYHRTYVKIDLDAIEHNIVQIKNKIGDKTKLLGVIKADAYGHGSVQIAERFKDYFDFFGVACVEEAQELINKNIDVPILVLGYVSPQQFSTVVENDIRIPIFSLESAEALSKQAAKNGKTASFHFCVDTGMSRIGFQVSEESADICKKVCELPNIKAEGLFSHFATADESDLTKAKAQRDKFCTFAKMLKDRGIDPPIKHLNNSAGIMNFDETFDMVRAGIVLYGLYPSEEVDKSLLDIRPAMQWKSHISHVKSLEKGREISYGGTYITVQQRIIATVPVGYADGYPRCLSNLGCVLVHGKRANIVGRVCMDQFMIDVTDIDNVKVEDEVTLVGTDGDEILSMEEVSGAAHSFNYELPCRIARRVPRVYISNGTVCTDIQYI